MILIDSNIWIDLLRTGSVADSMTAIIGDQQSVVCHPHVIGELMVGNLGPKRKYLLRQLWLLPQLPLLYDCIEGGATLWTNDKNLKSVAKRYISVL